jgi:translocation and assembly module TamB
MRRLKITALVTLSTVLLIIALLAAVMAWLVRSEQGSHWLLLQGLDLVPVTIEAKGISGTLADGLGVESLNIVFPTAEVKATQVNLSWSPVSLLAGIVEINNVHIAELGVDVLKEKNAGQSSSTAADALDSDRLFWLQFPVYVSIESGQIDKLRIEAAEFNNVNLAGGIGHGQLKIESLHAQIADIELQASGQLVGPGPGQLQAVASWQIPVQNLKGSGSFSGDIKKLAFTHVINVPEVVNFNGTISDLFEKPTLAGMADWTSIRLPGETTLFSNAGNIRVSSDFLSARLEGDNTILLDDWPQAPMQLQALVNLQGITIDSYSIEALDGHITGQGRIEYSDKHTGQPGGQLNIKAAQINTAKLSAGLDREELPGQIDFDAILKITSAGSFEIDVSTVSAKISDIALTGLGRARWHDEKLAVLDADIHAGSNQLTARLKMGKKLDGSIDVNASELVMLWPGLQGELNASVILGGSPERPQAQVTAKATAVSFDGHSLESFNFSGQLQGNEQLIGRLAATGLVSGKQQLGNLDMTLAGKLTDFRSEMKLAGGVVDVEFHSSGGWDGEHLTQRFEYGHIQPDGFESWQLEQQPELRLSAAAGQLAAHCWKQNGASICIDASDWGPGTLHSKITIDSFVLNTLQPLLAEGYSVDGRVNVDLKLVRNSRGLQGEFQWRQSRTVLAYSDEIDRFETVLDEVLIDLLSDDRQTNLTARLTGEQGLNVTANATVSGPLIAESPLQAAAKGRLPSIELLRPLARRVVQLGKLQGELTLDLDASGTLGDPLFTGGAYLDDGLLELSDAGVTLSSINVKAQSSGGDKLQVTGELRSGQGSASILGEVRATEKPGLEADIHIKGQNLASLRIPELSLDTSPDLKLHIGKGVFDISGSIMIPHATAVIRTLPKNAVPVSTDVIVHTPAREIERQQEMIVTGDVEVLLGDDVRFKGFGLNSRLEGGLRLTQSRGGFLRSAGTVRVRDGFLTGYGKELRVDRGELAFTGPLDDPLINIQVSRESIYENRQYIIGLRLTGSAQNVKTEPFSRPSMSERDVLAFLLLDRPPNNENETAGAALALGLSQLVPGGDNGILGLDEVSFETNDANQAAMVAGKRINDRLYVRYLFGTQGQPGAFRIRYSLGRGFSLESSTGARQSLDLIYMIER